jgi:hypothetical protein
MPANIPYIGLFSAWSQLAWRISRKGQRKGKNAPVDDIFWKNWYSLQRCKKRQGVRSW